MSGAVAKPLSLRLFLEGIEVPVVSASVQIGLNAPAVSSIQVVPLDSAMDLKPRTMVHLFFLDNYDVSAPTETAATLYDQDKASPDLRKNYKLLFTGEVVGFSFVQTPQSRAIILQCVDFSSYWDSAHATAIDWGPNGNAFHDDSFLSASSTNLFDNIVSQQPTVILGWLTQRPTTKSLSSVSGLAGGIIHMLEAMGGVADHHKGVNDFFTVAELRCRILSQIAAEENDNNAAKLMSGQVFITWLKNGLENIGLQVTFRDMMKLLFQYIYYDVVPNPAPYFIPATPPTIFSEKLAPLVLSNTGEGSQAIKMVRKIATNLVGIQEKFRNDTSTRLVVNMAVTDITDVVAKFNRVSVNASADAVNLLTLAKINLAKLLAVTTEKLDPNADFLLITIDLLNKAADKADSSTIKVGSTKLRETNAIGSRLITQIIRPDVFFVAPPRCNVIFPEHYTQVSYDRNFMSEVTRTQLLVGSGLLGNDRLFTDSIIRPSKKGNLTKYDLSKNGGKATYRVLMDHEVHTGIIPRSEWLPDSSAGEPGSDPGTNRSERVGWGGKAADFHFFKYRFGNRTASVGGKFNPYVVAGFPGVIITKPLMLSDKAKLLSTTDAGIIDVIADSSDIPKQIIGMIGSVSHNVDQNGGTTSISMHHARHHGGADDEFLMNHTEAERSVNRIVRVVIDYDASLGNKKFMDLLVGVTPQEKDELKYDKALFAQEKKDILFKTKRKILGKDEEVDILKSVNLRRDAEKAATHDARTSGGSIPGVKPVAIIPSPSGSIVAGSTGFYGGKIIGVEVIDSSIRSGKETGNKDAYTRVAIYEERSVVVSVKQSPESVMHPTWISDSYNNENIGEKIYGKFFGVGSVVDEIAFTGLNAGNVLANGKGLIVNSNDFSSTKDMDAAIRGFAKDAQIKSVESAVNFLAFVYGLVRSEGQDVDAFIRSYNKRPIASITDMLGSPDLEISVNPDGSLNTNGTLGFHSLAVHPSLVGNEKSPRLLGLLVDPETQMNRLGGAGALTSVPGGYDVRWEKRARVLDYLAKLQEGPAFRG